MLVRVDSPLFGGALRLFASVFVLSVLGGCPGEDPGDVPDAATDVSDAGGDGQDAGTDAGSGNPDAGEDPGVGCRVDADCAARVPATMPAGCAEARCDATRGVCRFLAKDNDADTFRSAHCTATNGETIEVGLDCNDANPNVKPGATEECNGQDDNCNRLTDEDIAPNTSQPCSVGLGVCEANGFAICVNGSWSGCSATAGQPQGSDAPKCDGTDYACDGEVSQGCECISGSVEACPPPPGDKCEAGERTCSFGKWTTCTYPDRAPYCLDADRDRYATSRENLCPGDVDTAAGWRPASECAGDEHAQCGGDGTRNPGAVGVCGLDQNCDLRSDVPPQGACSADAPRNETCFVNLGCGANMRGTRQCSQATACNWNACTLDPHPTLTWHGGDAAFGHNCGRPHAEGWFVPGDSNYFCMAQFGPYVNDLRSGTYKVGFKVWTKSGTNLLFEVAQNSGQTTIREHRTGVAAGDQCVVLENVNLGECSNIELRVRYLSDVFWSNSDFILKASRITPQNGGVNPCD